MSSDSEDSTAVGKLFYTRSAVVPSVWPPMGTWKNAVGLDINKVNMCSQ